MPTAIAAPAATHVAYISSTGTGHLDLNCKGLDRMREAGRNPATELDEEQAASLADLFDAGPHGFAPCRLCALEPVMVDLFTNRPPGNPVKGQPDRLFVVTALYAKTRRTYRSYSSTPNDRERIAQLKAEAARRIERVAAAGGLHTTVASSPLMYGHLPHRIACELDDRVSTIILKDVPDPAPSAEVIRTFWNLLTNAKGMEIEQAWQTANDIIA